MFTFDHGTDVEASLALNPPPPELATDEKAAVIVYLNIQPFAPLGTPADGVTVAPREPLTHDHYDICVLVGANPGIATRTVHENVGIRTGVGSGPTSTIEPSPSPTPDLLPAQIDPADCRAMRFTDARCLAVIERPAPTPGSAGLTCSGVTGRSIPR